jgi:hypothetical protein
VLHIAGDILKKSVMIRIMANNRVLHIAQVGQMGAINRAPTIYPAQKM